MKIKKFKKIFFTDNSRIVGGNKAKVPVPYQVSFQLKTQDFVVSLFNEYSHFCGGAIISENYVLTAAHCIDSFKPGDFTILSGTSNWKKGGDRHNVTSLIKHPDYKELVKSDIAVVKVDPPFVLDNMKTMKISYSNCDNIGGNFPVTLTGWGLQQPLPIPIALAISLSLPDELKMLNYTTISNQECQSDFDVTETEICARKGFLNGACSVSNIYAIISKC